jgi:hypothetical protein
MTISRASFLATLLLFTCLVTTSVESYSSGAGGCAGGKAAVASLHKARFLGLRSVRSGTLASKNLVVTLGTVPLTSSGTPQSFLTDTTYTINIQDNSGRMKGALIRVSVPGGTLTDNALLIPNTGAKDALVCPSTVRGITHTSSALKESFGGTLKISNPTSNVTFDITVVFLNKLFGGSSYVYGQFVVNFADLI